MGFPDKPKRNKHKQEEQTLLDSSDIKSRYTDDNSDFTAKEHGLQHEEKQKWSNDKELLLALISMSVGLGNVWRFPYIAYENGGGAFLIPYFIVVTFISRPLYFLESCLGQFSGYSSVKLWNMVPLFRGIGICQVISCVYVTSYYTSIIGLAAYYFVMSFQSELPWNSCNPDVQLWDGVVCSDSTTSDSTSKAIEFGSNNIINERTAMTVISVNNTTITVISPAEEYLVYEVLKEKETIVDGIGLPDANLTSCLAVMFFLLFISMSKGAASTGKAAYFNALFPYVVMLILMVKTFTLPGAWDGVKFLFVPQWEDLLNMSVWYNALMQSFYSLGIGQGGILNYTSFNHFRHDLYRYEIYNNNKTNI